MCVSAYGPSYRLPLNTSVHCHTSVVVEVVVVVIVVTVVMVVVVVVVVDTVVVVVDVMVVITLQCSEPSVLDDNGPTTDQSSQYPSVGVNTKLAHAGAPLHSAIHFPLA